MFAELGKRWDGELNVLVNTVGPGAAGSFEDLTDEQWRESVEDGVMGMVRCVRSALPLLRKAQWARIVNFSAHSTQRQSVMLPAYTAAKSMLTSVSKNLSLLLAKDEILVNVVSPGSIASESLVGLGEVGRCRRQRSLSPDGRDCQAFRTSGAHAASRPAGGNRTGRRVPGIAAKLLHDRSQHQRRRRFGLHLTNLNRLADKRSGRWRRLARRVPGHAEHCGGSATPCTRRFAATDGDDIDWDAYRTLVRYCVGDLGHPMLWCTSGIAEFWSLTIEERKRLLEVAIEEARSAESRRRGAGLYGGDKRPRTAWT